MPLLFAIGVHGRAAARLESAAAAPAYRGGGGGQLYAEALRDAHIKHGAPAHPIHATRST